MPVRNRVRPVLVVLVAALMLPAWTATAHAAVTCGGTGPNVRALTPATAPLSPGQSGWLSAVWTADSGVSDWSTKVTAPADVKVTYPTTRGGGDTSLYGNSILVGGTKDVTAFRLNVPYTRSGVFPVTLTTTYTYVDAGTTSNWWSGYQGWQSANQGPQSGWQDQSDADHDYWGNGRGYQYPGNCVPAAPVTQTVTATVLVPVVPASGAAFTQTTTRASVKAGTASWVNVGFTGGTGDLADFAVAAGTPLPTGALVGYPGDRASAGLAGDASLVGEASDYVALRFDATKVPVGSYLIPLVIRYTAALPVSVLGKITVDVS